MKETNNYLEMVELVNMRTNLRHICKLSKLRQSHLAEITGITKPAISRFLNGKKHISLPAFIKLMAIINVDYSYLISEHKEIK